MYFKGNTLTNSLKGIQGEEKRRNENMEYLRNKIEYVKEEAMKLARSPQRTQTAKTKRINGETLILNFTYIKLTNIKLYLLQNTYLTERIIPTVVLTVNSNTAQF